MRLIGKKKISSTEERKTYIVNNNKNTLPFQYSCFPGCFTFHSTGEKGIKKRKKMAKGDYSWFQILGFSDS